jgi:PhoPQ-activated pathogenicity-related protein
MLLWIDGGVSGRLPEQGQREPTDAIRTLAPVAIAAGLPAAVVRQVPYQPMFDGLVEDGLIAHSFVEFVRTGDPTWPLLLPMVKAAVEAMNAAEKIAGSRWGLAVDGFVATGASKRGWTTWLSAAVDQRIIGLVPAVIDMLSMEKHVGLQRASFGGMSDKLVDYTSRGIEHLFGTPRGRELVGIVDPLAYRDRLVQPKIIALGTNDPYWPLEACSLYYGILDGPRWVSYTPNAGHGLPAERLGGLVAAMGRHVAGLEDLPDVDWSIDAEGAAKVCRAACPDAEVEKAVAWTAAAPSRDFRKAVWKPVPAERDGEGWRLPLAKPTDGYAAGLIELHVARKPLPLILTSGVSVIGRL